MSSMKYKSFLRQRQWLDPTQRLSQGPTLCDKDLETESCLIEDAGLGVEDRAGIFEDADIGQQVFNQSVLKTMREERVSQEEAENEEAYQKLLVDSDPNRALVFVIREESKTICAKLGLRYNESLHEDMLALRLVTILLHSGANANYKAKNSGNAVLDKERSILYYAVKIRKNPLIVQKLLQHNARVRKGDLDLVLWEGDVCDEIRSMLIGAVANETFRNYLEEGDSKKLRSVKNNLHMLFEKMNASRIKVLDKLIDKVYGDTGKYKVCTSILDICRKETSPETRNGSKVFRNRRSILHEIIMKGDKEALSHDAIRVVLHQKWYSFACNTSICLFVVYLLCLVAFTFALIVASETPNPIVYDSNLQGARAFAEVIMCLATIVHAAAEIDQFIFTGLDYWMDIFNYLDLLSVVLFVVTVVLRYVALQASWVTLGITYFLWVMHAFTFTTIFRPIAMFSQILLSIIVRDVFQFVVVCLLILLAFSGFLVAALRFDGLLGGHQEIASFWLILATGSRAMVDQEPVLDYVIPHVFSAVVMGLFLFTAVIILLNILIARLSDTYQSIQSEAQHSVALSRAWIIMRLERQYCTAICRRNHNQTGILNVDLEQVLNRWDGGSTSEHAQILCKLQDQMNDMENCLSYISKKLMDLSQSRQLMDTHT